MAKVKGPFGDLRTPYWLSGSRTNVPAEPPSHKPCLVCHTVEKFGCDTERENK
jgi:hypothetical protein